MSGEAWPFEKTRWSPAGFEGSSKSSFRWPSSSTAIRSAADIEEVGWPEPPASLLRIGVHTQLLRELTAKVVAVHGLR